MSDRLLTDEAFLADCRMDFFRGSGPGGQKRNKTSNGVRLTHLPTRLQVTATESRSLAINKIHALRRMRIKFAAEFREPIDLLTFEPPDWFPQIRHERRIAASEKHPLYAPLGGLLLDLLHALNGNPAAVGVNLGINTSQVLKFLKEEPVFWMQARRMIAQKRTTSSEQ
jgi:hypothetical protein